jgi:hypothetical protein
MSAGKFLIAEGFLPPRRGRKPLGKDAIPRLRKASLSPSEHKKRYRDKKRREKQQLREAEAHNLVFHDPEFGSLTRQLGNPNTFVRYFTDREFPQLKELAKIETRELRKIEIAIPVYTDPNLRRLVGTATEYRLRAYFGVKPFHDSILKKLLLPVDEVTSSGNLWRNGLWDELCSEAEQFWTGPSFSQHVFDVRVERLICRYCVLFAHLAHEARAFRPPFAEIKRPTVKKLLAMLDNDAIEDVVGISQRFRELKNKEIAGFRIAFGGRDLAGSADVGGADFDLVVDGQLIDFKTRMKRSVDTKDLRQLVAYVLLDYDDEFRFDSVCCYFSRQNFTVTLSLHEILGPERRLAEVRRMFREEMRKFVRPSPKGAPIGAHPTSPTRGEGAKSHTKRTSK